MQRCQRDVPPRRHVSKMRYPDLDMLAVCLKMELTAKTTFIVAQKIQSATSNVHHRGVLVF